MKFNWSSLNASQMESYQNLCPVGEYRVLSTPSGLPGISQALADKCPVLVIAASGDSFGKVYYMANLMRPDPKDRRGNAIDQMPFGFVCSSRQPMLSGALIDHGNWPNRTTYPPTSSWNSLVAGEIPAYYGLSLVPAASAGPIEQLSGSTQQHAFVTLTSGLSAMYERNFIPPEIHMPLHEPGTCGRPPAILFSHEKPSVPDSGPDGNG